MKKLLLGIATLAFNMQASDATVGATRLAYEAYKPELANKEALNTQETVIPAIRTLHLFFDEPEDDEYKAMGIRPATDNEKKFGRMGFLANVVSNQAKIIANGIAYSLLNNLLGKVLEKLGKSGDDALPEFVSDHYRVTAALILNAIDSGQVENEPPLGRSINLLNQIIEGGKGAERYKQSALFYLGDAKAMDSYSQLKTIMEAHNSGGTMKLPFMRYNPQTVDDIKNLASAKDAPKTVMLQVSDVYEPKKIHVDSMITHADNLKQYVNSLMLSTDDKKFNETITKVGAAFIGDNLQDLTISNKSSIELVALGEQIKKATNLEMLLYTDNNGYSTTMDLDGLKSLATVSITAPKFSDPKKVRVFSTIPASLDDISITITEETDAISVYNLMEQIADMMPAEAELMIKLADEVTANKFIDYKGFKANGRSFEIKASEEETNTFKVAANDDADTSEILSELRAEKREQRRKSGQFKKRLKLKKSK